MAQQTRIETVLRFFDRFIARFPSIAALSTATEHDVIAAWSGLGYYRRARMLRDGAIAVVERFGGELPRTVEELLTIPGVGRYTAGAIASVAFDRHAPIVDGNITRIVARLFGSDGETWERAEALVDACRRPRIFNQGLMELGALVCTPRKPSCDICPLRKQCVALASGTVEQLPAPKPKKEMRELHIPLYLVRDSRGHVLMRRESGPLMQSMYHLPHGDTSLLAATPLEVMRHALVGVVRHTVTTRRITFAVYDAELRGRGEGFEWIDPAGLASLPHPSYVAKALALAKR